MARILIADLKKGANRLTEILANKHDLLYATTVEEVIKLAETTNFDMLIVGVLFDDSRMIELVKLAKETKGLASVPVIGFSDEHTKLSTAIRNVTENIMHIIGACDYIDTREMSDLEVNVRIESCLAENKMVSREVLEGELKPGAKRREQEKRRSVD